MRTYGNRVDPKSDENTPMKDRKEHMKMQMRPPHGGEDWSDTRASEGTSRKPGKRRGTDAPSEPPEGTNPSDN